MKFDCILFDLDGTLIDSTPLIFASFKHTFHHHFGRTIKDEELFRYMGVPLKQPFTELYPDHVAGV
jgi:pyrophosphatase PpaX